MKDFSLFSRRIRDSHVQYSILFLFRLFFYAISLLYFCHRSSVLNDNRLKQETTARDEDVRIGIGKQGGYTRAYSSDTRSNVRRFSFSFVVRFRPCSLSHPIFSHCPISSSHFTEFQIFFKYSKRIEKFNRAYTKLIDSRRYSILFSCACIDTELLLSR